MARKGDVVRYDGSDHDPTVISYDSGGTTGWAVISVHPAALTDEDTAITDNMTHCSWGQFSGSEVKMVDEMCNLADAWPGAALLLEQFILRKFSMNEALLSPVRLNAAFSYAQVRQPRLSDRREVYRQQPSLAMATVTDDTLGAIGLWTPTAGMPHARDALRHGLTFFKRIKTQGDMLRKVFPAVLGAK